MKKFYKRIGAFLIVLLLMSSVSAKDISVDYSLSDSVKTGKVRYISQIEKNDYYYDAYWGKFASYSSRECGTACISMALSYLGINETPENLGDYWIEKGYTQGEPFSTVFYDVPGATGGHTFDFETAYEKYENGGYSPVIIYFTRELNPYQTGNRHFVMVVDKSGKNEYIAIDPASDEVRTVTIEKTETGTFIVGTKAADGSFLSDELTEEELCSAQYKADKEVLAVKTETPEKKPDEKVKAEEPAPEPKSTSADPTAESVKLAENNETKQPELPKTQGESKKPYDRAASLLTAAIKKSIAE